MAYNAVQNLPSTCLSTFLHISFPIFHTSQSLWAPRYNWMMLCVLPPGISKIFFSFVNTKSSIRLLSDYPTLIFTEYFQQSLSISAFSSDMPYLAIISSHYSPQSCFFSLSSVSVTFIVLIPLNAEILCMLIFVIPY